ncbi:hypothetical protein BKA66DRAFT_191761 [Pyrenochaeta sp. MPI-SDFR-AT-0127]|nr:hypothetical protein BKA66DRAFT_191761 [Pyrenochaeta sp. MPI-SDFR-AT-0127]
MLSLVLVSAMCSLGPSLDDMRYRQRHGSECRTGSSSLITRSPRTCTQVCQTIHNETSRLHIFPSNSIYPH